MKAFGRQVLMNTKGVNKEGCLIPIMLYYDLHKSLEISHL